MSDSDLCMCDSEWERVIWNEYVRAIDFCSTILKAFTAITLFVEHLMNFVSFDKKATKFFQSFAFILTSSIYCVLVPGEAVNNQCLIKVFCTWCQ